MTNKLFFIVIACLQSISLNAQTRPSIAILGDSYSTFEGFVPRGNAVWYREVPDTNYTDVADVTDTWWWQVCKKGGYRLEVNESYSGACICHTDPRVKDPAARSFITRAVNLGSPDIILVFGGTNDCWQQVPMGDYKWEDFTPNDLLSYRPAVCKLGAYLYGRYPRARVYFILNTDLAPEIGETQRTVCQHYGFKFITLKDISKKSSHPDKSGMQSIAKQVLKAL